MADVYTTIAEADRDLQERLAVILEGRAADPQQQAMLRTYLGRIEFPPGAAVLEVGCGTGAVSRYIARLPGMGPVLGVDPSPIFLATARDLAADIDNLSFASADARCLPCGDASFAAVIFHTTLSHIPCPEQALAEAFRVLAPEGILAIFDGNYSTTTLATGDFDPLQTCADAAMAALVHDRWLIPSLPGLVTRGGFELLRQDSFSFVETVAPDYIMTLADRGADLLAAAGRIGPDLAAALKGEARRRVATGTFYGAVAYAALVARKGRQV